MEIVVIGGGVGGLTAAAALGQSGHQVQVLERGPRFAQGGPAVRLAPNATAVLGRLGVLDHVLELGTRPSRAVLRDLGSGAELAELDLGAPLTARYGTPYVVIGRADLLSVLADACADVGVELRAGREARAVSQSPAAGSAFGGAVAICTDGRSYAGDLVVGADGPRSIASALVLAGTASGARGAGAWLAAPAAEGWAAYRGTVPADALAGGPFGPDADANGAGDEVIAWMSQDAHFTRYPVRAGDVYEQVAVFRSRRYAQLADGGASAPAGTDYPSRAGLPAGDGTPAGAASPGGTGRGSGPGSGRGSGLPGTAGVADAAGVVEPARTGTADWGGPDELDEAFAEAAPEVRAAVGQLRRDKHWRMLDRPPLQAWASGRVALLGDAAHPMPAYLAQGACQAIEDAAALADTLARCAGPHRVSDALADYAALRAPRVSLVRQARQPWGREPLPRRSADDYRGTDWLYAPSGSLW